MSVEKIFSEIKVAPLRKVALSLAVLALAVQCLFIGQPGKPPLNLFNPIITTRNNVLSTPRANGLVTYSSKGNLNRETVDSDRDTVAILSKAKATANGVELEFPIISLVRSPSRTGPSNTTHRITPIGEQTQFPAAIARGELDPFFATALNPSEDLIVGFEERNTSRLAVLRNFDAAALGSAANPNPDLPISQFIRFNCSSNPPVQSQDGSIQYQPCNNDPARPDPTSSVSSISTVDFNCDNKLDIMVVADSTKDINDPNDWETGQRVFGCINYTTPGASSLDFRCRDQGFRSYRAASARPGEVATLQDTENESGCEGPDCGGGGGGGGVVLPPLPQGAKFTTNLGNSCSGEYRGIGANEYSVVEFLGNFSHPTPAIDALVTEFPVLVKAVELEFINNDALPDRVVLLQPAPSWELSPSADINSAARVEVCIRNPNRDGLECTT